MKKKAFMLILLFAFCYQSHGKNKVIFVLEPQVLYQSRITNLANNWSATGICISIDWGMLDTNEEPGIDDWSPLKNPLNSIMYFNNDDTQTMDLDIYIRINFGTGKPIWVDPSNPHMTGGIQDFHVKSDSSIYDYINDYCLQQNPKIETNKTDILRRYPLNFSSPNSKTLMKNFYEEVLEYLDTVIVENELISSRIIEVSPTFSHYQETEYPFPVMCGYSSFDNEAFVLYLKEKYTETAIGLDKLNGIWNPGTPSGNAITWSNINPRIYNWDTRYSSRYINGRADWMDFRTTLLASLLKEFADLNSTHGNYKFGVQFGCIYDDAIENRGSVDPTKLIEYADVVHVADTPILKENFNFGADYVRSLCKFWSNTVPTDRSIVTQREFTSESNAIEIDKNNTYYVYTDDSLTTTVSDAWKAQLTAYHEKGASAHFICDWNFPDEQLSVYNSASYFSKWKAELNSYKKGLAPYTTRSNFNNEKAVHLGCEYFLWNPNSMDANGVYEIQKSVQAESPYLDLSVFSWNDDGKKDIITNYMVERNPLYIYDYYKLGINFTRSSQYITGKAYSGFMKDTLRTIPYINQTLSSGKFNYTHGIRNEYNELRPPVNLIWRSRLDLQSVFPTAGAGVNENFIYWIKTYGVIQYPQLAN